MKKRLLVGLVVFSSVLNVLSVNAATVIKKEDAPLFSKKSIYSEIGVQDIVVDKGTEYSGLRKSDDALDKFTAVTATKNGNTYTNTWSNYKVTFVDQTFNANDIYDFNADGIKFDFGVKFADYSRIAIYYTRLSRDLNIVAANFAPGQPIDEVTIAGEPYKHVALDVEFPYGIERYNYYLRDVDGKLMVIETYHEDGREICREYLDEFEKAK